MVASFSDHYSYSFEKIFGQNNTTPTLFSFFSLAFPPRGA